MKKRTLVYFISGPLLKSPDDFIAVKTRGDGIPKSKRGECVSMYMFRAFYQVGEGNDVIPAVLEGRGMDIQQHCLV